MALHKISEIVSSAIPWKELREQVAGDGELFLEHFVGSTSSILVSELAKRYNKIVALYPDHESAQFLKSDLDELGTEMPLLFPPTNRKPYDRQQIVDSALMVQRSEVLEKIQSEQRYVAVGSASALFDKIASPETFRRASLTIEKGDEIDLESLKNELLSQQYAHVRFVDEPGEFATRGGIVDIYPYSGEYPVRLELFGDEIDSIRQFDPDTQRSIAHLNSVRIVPDATNLELGSKESLLTYFDEETLFLFWNLPLIQSEFEDRFSRAETAYRNLDGRSGVPEPAAIFLSPDEFEHEIDGKKGIHFGGFTSDKKQGAWTFRLEAAPQPEFNGSIKLLRERIQNLSNDNVETYILCDNEGQRDRFDELLGEPGETLRYHLMVNTLHEGFIIKQQAIAVFTDHQIFNRYHKPKVRRRRYHGGISFKELRDLSVGDYVVHVDYGIGTFAGFKNITVRGVEQESVVIRYKEDSVLYVNVSNLHKLQKYSGKEGTQPRIDKLGSGRWARKKAQTKSRVKNIARDLIKLYAERKAKDAYAFSSDTSWQTELEARFEYEETPDQRQAIQAVKNDMESETPMDRLVCGDVGFGKTEVALRAAFKAVMDHKQVAMLVPTTILADQHYHTFRDRMKDFPVSVEMLSRFKSKSEQKETVKKLADGTVDIIIGTHRLTS
ncbi:MAG: CarD family transcriptional regulator, partial [Balneolaceae bacterium]|nr:CarD family transcriptional regulator [Balneolaceae bacterium]